jgi:hypothetical protein
MITVALPTADHGRRPQQPGSGITIIPRPQREKPSAQEYLRTRRSPGSALTASLMPDAKYPPIARVRARYP